MEAHGEEHGRQRDPCNFAKSLATCVVPAPVETAISASDRQARNDSQGKRNFQRNFVL